MSDYKKIKCPCCGEYTIGDTYDICKNCFWEYDPVQNDKPNYAGGANCHSLNEYRKEFERKKKENPDFCCKNEQDKQYMIDWDHSTIDKHYCPLRNTKIDDGDCFETVMASYGQHAKSYIENIKKKYPNFEKKCNSCKFNKEREESNSFKVIGKYKYLGGESVSDLVVGNIYDRIEPEDEFRIVDDSGEDYLYLPDNFQLILNSNIEIIKGNITEMNVDAIVNASNNKLLRGSGLCGAIFQKAGYDLDKECNEIGTCDTGNAVITKGYELKAKYIIHTVAPRWYMTIPEEEKIKQLRNCYKNIFRVAIENKIKTLAIPCIGTGIYQCPIEIGRDLAFEEANKVADKFEKIYFVCFRDEEYEIYS